MRLTLTDLQPLLRDINARLLAEQGYSPEHIARAVP